MHIVRDGYDHIAERYLEWAGQIDDPARERHTTALLSRVPNGARVLDLGCGAGLPSTRALAERFDVTGVDVSAQQVRLARANVPNAVFVQGDLLDVDLPSGAFHAVTAFYVLAHLPRERLEPALANVRRWLHPGGWFLATLGTGDDPGTTVQWLGVPMFFSSHTPERNREPLAAAGFELAIDEIDELREPDGPASFQWVLAQARA